MTANVCLACSCDGVRGVARDVSRESGHRILCYCADCQLFGHYLARIRGEHEPSPFFNSKTGTTTVRPRVLSEAERYALVEARTSA